MKCSRYLLTLTGGIEFSTFGPLKLGDQGLRLELIELSDTCDVSKTLKFQL